MNNVEENVEVKELQMTEEEFKEFSKELNLEIDDIEKTNRDLTYFQEPIELSEDEILKNKNFKKGMEQGYLLGGILTSMVNSGFSREISEQYAVESVLLEKKLEIAKMEQDSKNLENEFNTV